MSKIREQKCLINDNWLCTIYEYISEAIFPKRMICNTLQSIIPQRTSLLNHGINLSAYIHPAVIKRIYTSNCDRI